MSTSTVLLALIATLLVGVISPGPSFLLVSRISVVQSRAHGLAAALGMGLGVEAEPARAEHQTNVVELHPQAVRRFKENVEDLAAFLTDPDANADLTVINTFRSYMAAVIVRPRKAGQEYEISIRGHLAEVMGAGVSDPLQTGGPFAKMFWPPRDSADVSLIHPSLCDSDRDGEVVRRVDPHIGLLHRGTEKLSTRPISTDPAISRR